MEPSAKSLILDLLQTLRGRSMPVRALVEAGALFGRTSPDLVGDPCELLEIHRRAQPEQRGAARLDEWQDPLQRDRR